jgi:tetratricopeptide (TPR) repeat protein
VAKNVKDNWKFFGQAAAIVLLTVVVYIPVLRCGYVWDDDDHLTANPAMTLPGGLHKIWTSLTFSRYYPLTLTTFWVQRRLWGLNPLPYHAVNVVLHGVNGVLVYALLRAMKIRGSWVAAALWAVHPVNVESAAWITELKNVQSGLFFFLALLCFLRFERQPHRRWYALSLLCATAALVSKPSTVVLPLLLLLCAWWQRGRWTRDDFTRVAPFFVLAAATSVLTILEQRGHIERGAHDWTLTLSERFLVAGTALWFYAAKAIWPVNLILIYPRWDVHAGSPVSSLPLLAAIAVAVTLWQWRQREWARASFFGLGYFVVALLPVLGFFDVFYFRYSFVADHFQYLASLGVVALAVTAATRLLRQRAARTAVSGAVLTALSALSWQRCGAFRDGATLWRDTIAKNPGCWMAYDNLGRVLQDSGKVSEAIGQYEQALRVKPDDPVAHNNWGNALLQAHKIQDAIDQLEQALRIKPDFVEAYNNLGNALLQAGRGEDAIRNYEQVLQIDPGNAVGHYSIGRAWQQMGKLMDAIPHYERALQSDPDFADAHNNLGDVFRQAGRIQDAIDQFGQALRIKPDFAEAHYNMGLALSQINQTQDAIGHYQQALRINPDYPAAHNNLGNALLQAGRIEDAIGHYQQALRSDPNSAIGHYNLGNILLQAGRTKEAIGEYQAAVQLQPDFPQAREILLRLLAPQ